MKHIIAFIAGATLGSLATFMVVKKKYEQIAQEEIDSVKAVYSKKKSKENIDEEQGIQVDEKEVEGYEDIIESSGYSKYSDISKNKTKAKHEDVERPYIIRPEEFGDIDGYELISLTHYSDGVLTDDDDQRMTDEEVGEVVGADYAEHFGEYEDDSVFVRNDKLKCDYEILLDQRKYSELRNITYHKGLSD
jgi:hypothetical protein